MLQYTEDSFVSLVRDTKENIIIRKMLKFEFRVWKRNICIRWAGKVSTKVA